MATISGYDSNSISTLFSSLNTSSSSSTGNSIYNIDFSEYASIKSGSYFKLLKSYYSEVDTSSKTSSKTNESTSTSEDSTKTLANVKSTASELAESAKELYTKSSKSVFNEVTTTDSEGNKVKGYDVDAIYEKVSAFVSDYNSLIAAAGKSNTDSIANGAASLVNITKNNEDTLKQIGITMDEDDYTLSIDEDSFKDSDMEIVKKLFYGTSSYAYSAGVKASMLESYATSESAKANTYTSSGSYSNNYNTGNIFSDYF
ncbi:MAG: hypothetical protein J6B26_01930 [Agathobacter sp.]|nr:hypothetical protein [Agathobacter sp.]